MHCKKQVQNSPSRGISCAATFALAIVFALALIQVFTQLAQAQTFKVIHTFIGGPDGRLPEAGLTLDRAGNIYGTTVGGGDYNGGVAFKLSYRDLGWVLTPLHSFGATNDGEGVSAGVVFGPNGSLYGTTTYGGGVPGCAPNGGCGTVFNLQPPLFVQVPFSTASPWMETKLYSFLGGSDGNNPGWGDLVFDRSGNIYGATVNGGLFGNGAVFKLTSSNHVWAETLLYSFAGGSDGSNVVAGVIFDAVGNLYGTTFYGTGNCFGGCGTVFQLRPSGSAWIKTVLHSFSGGAGGNNPFGGLIFDELGNLYGTTEGGGSGESGTVFQLSPSDGGWTYSVLYSFTSGGWPLASLTVDAAGNLYGTTIGGGAYQKGTVFKLTHSNGGWTYTSLHDFTGGSDGYGPQCNVTPDANGNIWGTTQKGGDLGCNNGEGQGCGVVWEIMP